MSHHRSVAGYSGTPLWKKLGMKPGCLIAVKNEPDGFGELLRNAPPGCTFLDSTSRRSGIHLAILFAADSRTLHCQFPPLKLRIDKSGGLWVCWPKKSSRVETDLSFENVQPYGLEQGLVDNKVCAIDDTWSALRFVYRKGDR